MALTLFIKCCRFIVHSTPQQYDTIGYSREFPETKKKKRKKLLIFYLSPNVATKPTDQCSSNSIFRVPLKTSPACFIFYYRPTLKIKGSLHKKQANELSDKHGIL